MVVRGRTAHALGMRAFHLFALALVECSSPLPSLPTPTVDASTLEVPLVHVFDDDDGRLLYAQAADGEVFSGEHLDHPEPAISRALSITGYGSLFGFGWDCAALPTGEVLCKGDDVAGSLGATPTTECQGMLWSTNPCVLDWTALPDVHDLRQIHGTCGVDYSGNVVCWAGPTPTFPRPVRELTGTFAILNNGDLYSMSGGTPILTRVVQATSAESGGNTSCAITDDTSLYCWGDNESGQVGDGTTTNRDSPVLIGAGYRHVRTDAYATCAIRMDETVACWGDVYVFNPQNDQHECGVDDTCTPLPVVGLSNVKEIAGLSYGFDALLDDGSVVHVSWPASSPTIGTTHPSP